MRRLSYRSIGVAAASSPTSAPAANARVAAEDDAADRVVLVEFL
jgi:hypothetical protein